MPQALASFICACAFRRRSAYLCDVPVSDTGCDNSTGEQRKLLQHSPTCCNTAQPVATQHNLLQPKLLRRLRFRFYYEDPTDLPGQKYQNAFFMFQSVPTAAKTTLFRVECQR